MVKLCRRIKVEFLDDLAFLFNITLQPGRPSLDRQPGDNITQGLEYIFQIMRKFLD